MESRNVVFLLLFSIFCLSVASRDGRKDELRVYIVTVKDRDGAEIGQHQHTESWHSSLLSTVIPDYSSRLVYSYHSVINGFAARLTKSEVEALSKQSWFIKATPSPNYKLLTTHSPSFLGLNNPKKDPQGVWSITSMGEGIIIGVLDTGISPGHPSFRDEGLPPPPRKWKGHCDFNSSVCNNKLIGARSILNASGDITHIPPIDKVGHGMHVASIAAGAFVNNVKSLGSVIGTASGVAPRAHLAFYKICLDEDDCQGADILKAIETAVDDGVDVLSLSFGKDSGSIDVLDNWATNPVTVGTFYAMSRGVLVSCAGGNDGPGVGSIIDNDMPWLLTVGASTTDKRMSSIVELGNGVNIDGEALMRPKRISTGMMPLKYLEMFTKELDKDKIQGKIVLCEMSTLGTFQMEKSVHKAGGAGLILWQVKKDGYTLRKVGHRLPTSTISYEDGIKIREYIRSTSNASATILFKGVVMNFPRSPAVLSYSSRGPSKNVPGILKPDIIGPGVDIIAAYPPDVKLEDEPTKYAQFAYMDGTSMSAPHLAGVAALIKKKHPDWSPAAIKSAIMTTASVTDRGGRPITDEKGLSANFYAMGAGHVDPRRALDPGLVYDVEPKEYIPFLCGLGLTDTEVHTIISPLPAVKCSHVNKVSQEQLNYPSIIATLSFNSTAVIERTVRNVGDANSTYSAEIKVPTGISARITPTTLSFNKKNELKKFTIAFTWEQGTLDYAEGQLRWISTKHVVRSPIVITKAQPKKRHGWSALKEFFGSVGKTLSSIASNFMELIRNAWRSL